MLQGKIFYAVYAAFLASLIAACSLFKLPSPYELIIFFKKESQRILSVTILYFKIILLVLLNLLIGLQSALLWLFLSQYVTPHVERYIRRHSNTTGNRLQIRIDLESVEDCCSL
jgi:hypothetical protein